MNASAGLSIHQQLIALLNRSHARLPGSGT
ncbi:Uncharacterised protein [Klebsiella oxytoca]|nr:Uncharacterised protein [Klebsiella oxytoca]